MFVCISISVAIKKGRSEGTTLFANRFKPFFTAGRFDLENINKQKVKHKNIKGIKFLFSLSTYIFNFGIINLPLVSLSSTQLRVTLFPYIWYLKD